MDQFRNQCDPCDLTAVTAGRNPQPPASVAQQCHIPITNRRSYPPGCCLIQTIHEWSTVAGQMPTNPVFSPGSPSEWDESVAVVTTVMDHENIFEMCYQGDADFCYAASRDEIARTKPSVHNPVLSVGVPDSWDQPLLAVPNVGLAGPEYIMWYGGNSMWDHKRFMKPLWISHRLTMVGPKILATSRSSHPNPTRITRILSTPQTVIRYSLPMQVRVSLRIFDVSGGLVPKLVDGEVLTPGRHAVTWNGRNDVRQIVTADV